MSYDLSENKIVGYIYTYVVLSLFVLKLEQQGNKETSIFIFVR